MYQIILKKQAKNSLGSFQWMKRIVSAIEQLPNGEDIKKLKGHNQLMRLRVGSYRIIYTVDCGELVIIVIDAGSRGQIYNKYWNIRNNGLEYVKTIEESIILSRLWDQYHLKNNYASEIEWAEALGNVKKIFLKIKGSWRLC